MNNISQTNTQTFIEESLKNFNEKTLLNPEGNPHAILVFIFSKLYKKYGEPLGDEIKYSTNRGNQYAKFPLFGGEIRKDFRGWLCISRKDTSSTLEYFYGFEPYATEAVYVADLKLEGGYFRNGILSEDYERSFPVIQLRTKVQISFWNSLDDLKNISKATLEIISIIEPFGKTKAH